MPFAMYSRTGSTVGTCKLLGIAICLWITTNHPSSFAVPKFSGNWRSCSYFISAHSAFSKMFTLANKIQDEGSIDHRLLEDFFDRSSCSLQHFTFNDDYLDEESAAKYLTIPFLETIPDIQIYLGGSWDNDILQRMDELKNSQDTPTFRRLQISYPTCNPAFTWK